MSSRSRRYLFTSKSEGEKVRHVLEVEEQTLLGSRPTLHWKERKRSLTVETAHVLLRRLRQTPSTTHSPKNRGPTSRTGTPRSAPERTERRTTHLTYSTPKGTRSSQRVHFPPKTTIDDTNTQTHRLSHPQTCTRTRGHIPLQTRTLEPFSQTPTPDPWSYTRRLGTIKYR